MSFTLLAIKWGEVGMLAAQLLLSLSILVILHEFGHYITAKWFKCRVEKFYLFFDPWFSLFKKKVGDTEYGVGWLPLGGYVKISGMIDESMDKDQMKLPPQPYEFRAKPAWQRLIIMLGGVIVNILLAFVIYAFVLMVWGEKKVEAKSIKDGIAFNDPIFHSLGFKNGDKIIAIDQKPLDDYNELLKKLIVVDDNVTIIRDGKEQVIKMPVDLIGQLIEKRKKSEGPMISPRVPAYVSLLADSSPAKLAGLQLGDQIISIDSNPVTFFDEAQVYIKTKEGNDAINLGIKRNDSSFIIATHLKDGKVGFNAPMSAMELDSMGVIKYSVTKYGFFAAFPAGVKKAGYELSSYINQFKKILSPSTGGYKGLSGFKGMASVFNKYYWDWEQFWTMTAFFSIALAFMNLLPIPALDGGHVLFTLGEMITGRKPSEKFLEYAQIAGMVILLSLMLYANGNDWFGWGK
ncbi:MAG TPA: RIP metalloprotease RseP [Ferruginibacter sp.]|nr:RIP metalloprotease RseP [Ferruginibacter sp.]HRE64528.1 RIP metalloprotease RseP [Ferruginibacter sp.]